MYDIKINSFSFSSYKNIVINSIEGFSPPSATISRKKQGKDGTSFTGSTRDERNIVINFSILNNVKETRGILYDNIRTGEEVIVTVDNSKKITGYIETFELNNFQQLTTGQISIICPDPYFYSVNPKKEYFYGSLSGKNIELNSSESDCDYVIEVRFYGNSNGFQFVFWEGLGQKTCKINYEFKTNDVLRIEYDNRKILINGVNKYSSKNWTVWPSLKKGTNTWFITALSVDEGSITINEKYLAV